MPSGMGCLRPRGWCMAAASPSVNDIRFECRDPAGGYLQGRVRQRNGFRTVPMTAGDRRNAIGMSRPVGPPGRITLPAALRKTLGIKPGSVMEFFVESNRIILRKVGDDKPCCVICSGTRNLAEIRGAMLCLACIDAVKKRET